MNHLIIRFTTIEEVPAEKDGFLELFRHRLRGWLKLVVKLLAVRISVVLVHGLTNLIASFEIR